jgi:hypothetical protein
MSNAVQPSPHQRHEISFKALPSPFEQYVVRADVMNAEVSAELCKIRDTKPVLLMNSDFWLHFGAKEILEQAAGRIINTAIGGVTANVLLPNDRNIYTKGIHGYLTYGWHVCAEEAPLLVQRDLLCGFTQIFSANKFKQWQLHQWLVYGESLGRKQVVNLPRTLYQISGVDPTKCFSGYVAVGKPQQDVQRWEEQKFIDVEFALPVLEASMARKERFLEILRATCKHPSIGEIWFSMAENVKLCSMNSEHGLHTLKSLKSALLEQCGGWCVFSVLHGLDSAQIGWRLDENRRCWQPITFLDSDCAKWYKVWKQSPNSLRMPAKLEILSFSERGGAYMSPATMRRADNRLHIVFRISLGPLR